MAYDIAVALGAGGDAVFLGVDGFGVGGAGFSVGGHGGKFVGLWREFDIVGLRGYLLVREESEEAGREYL